MDPVEALKRIAFLLERSQAPTYRVAAFRRAAETITGLVPGELERMATNERLRSLMGIGEATEAVILEAMAGKVPDYLAKLEADRLRLLLPAMRSGQGEAGAPAKAAEAFDELLNDRLRVLELNHPHILSTSYNLTYRIARSPEPA